MLSPAHRAFWLFVNLALGLLPGFLFFAWVERNCSLPWFWISEKIRWPWIYLETDSLFALAAFDVSLVLAFGTIHTATAQPGFQSRLSRFVPAQAVRTVFLVITGLSLLCVMGLWQNTGQVLWAAPFSPAVQSAVSLTLFWGLLAISGKVAQQFDASHFFGWKQLRSSGIGQPAGNERLQTSGFYGWVRHPIYTLTMLAFIVTPFMSLDRMLVTLASLLYLAFGIPIEERKLIALFGPPYEHYRKRVPALFPFPRKSVLGSKTA